MEERLSIKIGPSRGKKKVEGTCRVNRFCICSEKNGLNGCIKESGRGREQTGQTLKDRRVQ